MSRSFYPSGNISASVFVKADTSNAGKVLQSTAGSGSHGDFSLGISQEGTHLAPWAPLDDGFAGIAGSPPILVYDEGDECLLVAGAAVAVGDLLKSDANGNGITASTTGDQVGAIALEPASAQGVLIKVKVTVGRKV